MFSALYVLFEISLLLQGHKGVLCFFLKALLFHLSLLDLQSRVNSLKPVCCNTTLYWLKKAPPSFVCVPFFSILQSERETFPLLSQLGLKYNKAFEMTSTDRAFNTH